MTSVKVRVGRPKDSMLKWRYLKGQDVSCHCATLQTMTHLSICPIAPGPCTLEDLVLANQKATDAAQY